ncbi:MAG: 16S rRNA (cytosine(1402)-N(4))-methyltransferase RsmH [Patescibacteria group bacterium]
MSVHKTVLLQETIEGLNLKSDSTVLDGTFGGGGHSLGICKKFSKSNLNVKIIALDQDKSVYKEEDKFKDCSISFVNDNFRNIDKVLGETKVDGIIFDLGLSSDQLENSGRGFSFMKDEPLFMTMKDIKDNLPSSEDVTAHEVVNTWGEESLADIIYGYGEERQARRIAKAIVESRKRQEIKTTFDLVKIIEDTIPARFRRGKIHFATKTFQAIRIAVNDELGAIGEGLDKGFAALRTGGRIAVISFHSLEDRIVKKFYKIKEKEGKGILINKKVILASKEEIKNNPRSRSAKLRILEKIKI